MVLNVRVHSSFCIFSFAQGLMCKVSLVHLAISPFGIQLNNHFSSSRNLVSQLGFVAPLCAAARVTRRRVPTPSRHSPAATRPLAHASVRSRRSPAAARPPSSLCRPELPDSRRPKPPLQIYRLLPVLPLSLFDSKKTGEDMRLTPWLLFALPLLYHSRVLPSMAPTFGSGPRCFVSVLTVNGCGDISLATLFVLSSRFVLPSLPLGRMVLRLLMRHRQPTLRPVSSTCLISVTEDWSAEETRATQPTLQPVSNTCLITVTMRIGVLRRLGLLRSFSVVCKSSLLWVSLPCLPLRRRGSMR
jgi:hypothetical protein